MIRTNKHFKSQISVFESIFISLLFIIIVSTLINKTDFTTHDFETNTQSLIDTIYYSETFRQIILNENLSQNSTTQDWTNITNLLNQEYINYELIISNLTSSKKIHNCSGELEKIYSEKIIFSGINNTANFEFRIIRLGVCN